MFRLWFKHFNQNPPLSSGGSLNIRINLLTSLKYCSSIVLGNFDCSNNNLKSLSRPVKSKKQLLL